MPQAFQKLGRYILVNEIARGGMAIVYHAKLVGVEGFEKDVAIKKILPHWTDQQEFVDMLIDEAKILVHLHHNNIVQVIELAKEKDNHFIVMEYVDGFHLKQIISRLDYQREKKHLGLCLSIFAQICSGLSFAHNRKDRHGVSLQIVHRDISPQNILLNREGEVKITDFGIAKITGRTHTTGFGVLKGKCSYMSPEQTMGRPVDLRSDIFSLGALLYEMLTGQKCFEGAHDFEVMAKVRASEFAIPEFVPFLLQGILRRALHPDVQARYQTVQEFCDAVLSYQIKNCPEVCSRDLKEFIHESFLEEKVSHVSTHREESAVTGCRVRTTDETVLHCGEDQKHPATEIMESACLPVGTLVYEKTILDEIKERTAIKKSSRRHLMTGAIFFLFVVLAAGVHEAFSLKKSATPLSRESPENSSSLIPVPGEKVNNRTWGRKSPCVQLFASVKIVSSPPDAVIKIKIGERRISLDQGQIFFLPEEILPIEVQIAVTREGYQTKELIAKMDDQHLLFHENIGLERIRYGTVSVSVRPWGNAHVKGFGTQNTPAVFKVPVGRQVVGAFHPPSRKTVSRSIEVKEQGRTQCRASFTPDINKMICW